MTNMSNGNTHRTGRNHVANVAHARNSAGSMRDKRAPRGGSRNAGRDIMDDYMSDIAAEKAEALAIENDRRWADAMAEDAANFAEELADHGITVVWPD